MLDHPVKEVDLDTAAASPSYLAMEWSPLPSPDGQIRVSITAVTDTGDPREIDCIGSEFESVAEGETMSHQGMRQRVEQEARRRNIPHYYVARDSLSGL